MWLPSSRRFWCLALLVDPLVDAVCYTPGGRDRNKEWGPNAGNRYRPCAPKKAVSMCCSRGGGDQCIGDGLCYNPESNVYWRESCTDPTWKDPACIKLFVNGTGFDPSDKTYDKEGKLINDVSITPCDDGSYCYGSVNRECCAQGNGVFIVNGEQNRTNPNSTSSLPPIITSTATDAPAAATTSFSTSPSTTPSTVPTPNSSLSTGAKAGIGIGVTLGAALVALLVLWLLRKRTRKQPLITQLINPENDHKHPALGANHIHELQAGGDPADSKRHTMASTRPSELDSSVLSSRQQSLAPMHQEMHELSSEGTVSSSTRNRGELRA